MRYHVRVKLNKSMIEVDENRITVGVQARPEKGKANQELIKKIAKHFKVPLSWVRIVSGVASRNKIVEIKD